MSVRIQQVVGLKLALRPDFLFRSCCLGHGGVKKTQSPVLPVQKTSFTSSRLVKTATTIYIHTACLQQCWFHNIDKTTATTTKMFNIYKVGLFHAQLRYNTQPKNSKDSPRHRVASCGNRSPRVGTLHTDQSRVTESTIKAKNEELSLIKDNKSDSGEKVEARL